MSLNFPAAFGYQVVLQPLTIANLELADLARPIPLAASGTPFINNGSVVAPTENVISVGTGSDFRIGVGTIVQTTTTAAITTSVATLTFATNTIAVGALVDVSGFTGDAAVLNGIHTVTAQSGTTISFASTTATLTSGAAVGTVRAATPLGLAGSDRPVLIQGLSDASPSETESTEEITVYDTITEGFDLSLGTKKGLSWTFNGYKSFTDAGLKIVELCSLYSVSAGMMVKYCITGPTGFNEQVYGFARVGAYSEQRPAGTAVKFTCTLNAYGPPRKKFHTPVPTP